MRAATVRISLTAVAAMVGFAVGWVVAAAAHVMPKQENYAFLKAQVPLPHHVSQYPGGLSFRFAMAHDVIHERFAKHGLTHYRERDRLTREKLASLGPDDPAGFPSRDDLAVGLERLGKSSEAVDVMRDKLVRQRNQGIAGRGLYTSFANLGTFLIHANFAKAMAGDAEARARFREGVGLIRESVEVNPEAHFGRERWQAAIAEFLLASMDDSTLLRKFDCLGNRLDLEIEALLNREGNWVDTGYGRPYDPAFSQDAALNLQPPLFPPGVDLDDPKQWPQLIKVRPHITKVGAEEGWDAVPVPSHRTPVPFDGPILGIIGMWRQGGGANPHFCLAIGETMLRVGQRYLAWAAFERATQMADRFGPDEATHEALREHCRKRQAQIEQTLTFRTTDPSSATPWQQVSPPPEAKDIATLRAQFDRELSFGQAFQKAYQEYEEKEISAGKPITDPHFFDEFLAGRGPIASPTGPEEWFVGVPRARRNDYAATRRQAWGIFGAGLAAMPVALVFRWLPARQTRKPPRLDAQRA